MRVYSCFIFQLEKERNYVKARNQFEDKNSSCKRNIHYFETFTTKCRNVYEDLKLTEKIPNERRSELLLSIPNHKPTGDDGISVKILEIVAPAVTSMYIK